MNRKKIPLISVIVVAILLIAVVVGFVYSKYVREDKFTGTANISANLGQIQVLESPAEKQDNGSYVLNESADPVTSNTYVVVLPGLDIPKNPYVYIKEKSSIPVYVYVEVLNGLGTSNLSFDLTENWISLDLKGTNGGDVYVYGAVIDGDKTPIVLDNNVVPDELIIPILANDKVIVSDKLNRAATDLNLNFYAYMAEVAAGSDAKSAFTNAFNVTP